MTRADQGAEMRPEAGPETDPVRELFASSSVAEHVVRGIVGLVLAVTGLALAGQSAWALLLLPVAALAWRGCPTCWALGLAQTVSSTITAGRSTPARSCRLPR